MSSWLIALLIALGSLIVVGFSTGIIQAVWILFVTDLQRGKESSSE